MTADVSVVTYWEKVRDDDELRARLQDNLDRWSLEAELLTHEVVVTEVEEAVLGETPLRLRGSCAAHYLAQGEVSPWHYLVEGPLPELGTPEMRPGMRRTAAQRIQEGWQLIGMSSFGEGQGLRLIAVFKRERD